MMKSIRIGRLYVPIIPNIVLIIVTLALVGIGCGWWSLSCLVCSTLFSVIYGLLRGIPREIRR